MHRERRHNGDITHQFNHVGLLHGRHSAADDARTEAAKLYEIVSKGVVQCVLKTCRTLDDKLICRIGSEENGK